MSWIKYLMEILSGGRIADDLNVEIIDPPQKKIETDVVACIEDALDHQLDRQSWKTWLRADRIL